MSKDKRKTHANGKANGKSNRKPNGANGHDPRVSGRASTVYRLLIGKTTRERAIAMIRNALKSTQGRVDLAASKLSVSSRTLSRWLAIANLREFASSQRAANSVPGPRL